jgi:dihydrofolate reductase
MRNVICAMNISIDGCYDHTKLSGGEEILEYFTQIMQGVDQIVTGRKMHQLMTPYWDDVAITRSGTPTANTFADTITAIPKIVVSRTLNQVEGGPRILRDNPESEIRKLKEAPGKKISIGGVSLRSQLMALGLIDEFYFVIHPILAGSGPRLLEDTHFDESMKMELVGSKIMQSGCVALHYLKKVTV